MSRKFLQTSSVLTLIGMSFFSFSARSMDRFQEDAEINKAFGRGNPTPLQHPQFTGGRGQLQQPSQLEREMDINQRGQALHNSSNIPPRPVTTRQEHGGNTNPTPMYGRTTNPIVGAFYPTPYEIVPEPVSSNWEDDINGDNETFHENGYKSTNKKKTKKQERLKEFTKNNYPQANVRKGEPSDSEED